ncbi:hypothetical protein DV735_g935, partial [Chaetothyriales sp. CBS 134920]
MSIYHISIIVYAYPSLKPDEAHVALCVNKPDLEPFYIYHATEDTNTDAEMKFQREVKDRDPRGSLTPHQEVPLPSISESQFAQLDSVLRSTQVPRPKAATWNCQTWVKQAMDNMESANLLPSGAASAYYAEMMSRVDANTTKSG